MDLINKYFSTAYRTQENDYIFLQNEINPSVLKAAYEYGIFPWPMPNEKELTWFAPAKRGVLFLNQIHYSKSLSKLMKNHPYTITFNQSFEQVINLCASVKRNKQQGTWITSQIISAYCELYQQGNAFSVEVWNESNLIGGLYGTQFGKIYSGESMFSLENNASKLALSFLCEHLQKQNITWLDIQVVTPLLESFGAKLISRSQFQKLLTKTSFSL